MCLESYCCNLKKEDWIKQYAEYLVKAVKGEPKLTCLYSDPDGTWKYKKSVFYNNLAKFLNSQEKSLNIKKEYKWTYKFDYDGGKVGGIYVFDNENNKKPVLILRSDQFGFSVPRNEKTLEHKYPYGDYLLTPDLNLLKEDSDSIEVKSKKVAEWVWNTRTIGGSFLWPITKTSNGNRSIYNMNRGVGYYIQDRVDLTLLEIKEFYALYKDYKNYEDIKNHMMYGTFLLKGEDGEKIFKWLSHFESFENYVSFFCFDEFIVQREQQFDIVDIARSNLIENKKENLCTPKFFNVPDDYKIEKEKKKKQIKMSRIKYFYEGDAEPCNNNDEKRIETIEKMLTNVTILILKRSERVDEILKQSE